MGEIIGKLSVLFEDPFWVGIFERMEDGNLSVARLLLVQSRKITRFIFLS